ncbi:N-6 DNA methylase [Larkinella terrae]|uniref:N-6 DNA methylase n=1 Tax=Larkinella terrae TaxID=2025311 RepID=A0A7K0EJA4_9BACT|nr:N-6 DNA methylase [Larkinella terrae]MRS61897.1 N-6 DNA methylase [Larkinella terrae]
MLKSTVVPHELRAFNKLFSQMEHGFNYSSFFSDFVEFLTESFMPQRVGVYERLKQQYGDLDRFVQLTQELILLQQSQIVTDTDWYDGLGNYYECLTSRGKSQLLGQFFTPEHVCDLMVRLQGCEESLKGKRQKVYDPSCGSGRLLLAFHALAPGNYHFAADLDPICARMTAVNMALHGCEGEAVCMDSLKWEWRFGYRVNRLLPLAGCPSIETIEPEDSYLFGSFREKKQLQPDPSKPAQTRPQGAYKEPQHIGQVAQNGQLILF